MPRGQSQTCDPKAFDTGLKSSARPIIEPVVQPDALWITFLILQTCILSLLALLLATAFGLTALVLARHRIGDYNGYTLIKIADFLPAALIDTTFAMLLRLADIIADNTPRTVPGTSVLMSALTDAFKETLTEMLELIRTARIASSWIRYVMPAHNFLASMFPGVHVVSHGSWALLFAGQVMCNTFAVLLVWTALYYVTECALAVGWVGVCGFRPSHGMGMSRAMSVVIVAFSIGTGVYVSL